jgi:hypothetical protein
MRLDVFEGAFNFDCRVEVFQSGHKHFFWDVMRLDVIKHLYEGIQEIHAVGVQKRGVKPGVIFFVGTVQFLNKTL